MNEPDRELNVQRTEAHGRTVLKVTGEVDLRTSPQLRELLLEAAEQTEGALLLDLADVSYMDSSGVGTMVYVKREIERDSRQMILVGLQPRVRSVFEITHLDKFFKIVDRVEDVEQA